ncbi:MAG: dipeptidase [Fusobacteriaceae bacterium]|jgi:membrane dipeptidase|nr:dipeptidase [Fusobacteriaceae bacterium]
MPILDLHCDTLTEMLRRQRNLSRNDLCVDIEKMNAGGVCCQFFAMFVQLAEFRDADRAWDYMLRLYDIFQKETAKNPERIRRITSAAELSGLRDVPAAVLTLEEGGILGGRIERIDELYRMGVRLITLTWNYENCLGYPNSDEAEIMEAGLKPFGLETLEKMNDLGILADVSHLSDGGFRDVLKYSKKPVVASHSNARALAPHKRNLTDAMIRNLAEKGGIMGINFYGLFLGNTGPGTIRNIVAHIKHIKNKGGIDCISIGSDFDGFTGGCELRDAAAYPQLTAALEKAGFTSDEIEKITWKNALRVMKEALS